MEHDPIPNQDEDFDGEEWDPYPDLIPRLIWFHYAKMGLSYSEWLDLLTPVWLEQIKEQRAGVLVVGMKELNEFNHPTNWHLYNQNEQQPVTFKRGIRTYTGTLVGVEEPIVNCYGYDVPPREMFFLVEVDGDIVTVNINSFVGGE